VTDPVPVPVGKVGRLTRDPELRFAKSGTAVASFGFAVKPYVPTGQPEPDTTFYEVVSFAGLAEHVAGCLQKGDRVVVAGSGEIEHWTGRDGVERTTKKIVAEAIGPDLRFVGVDVQRPERRGPAQAAFDDEEPF
jgi:single-strand DNA-binding protein